ncbi:MAG: ECF transporter S component [Bacilli bacterium]|nr:ECF transporter S component [Bacilli bacterium]
MKKESVQQMAISAILIAIIALMTFTPVGYVTIGTVFSICTIHIVVLLAAMLFGWKQGLVSGLAFGGLCLMKAAIMPTAATDALFINPLVSVLPRVLFGIISGVVFDYLRRIKNKAVRSVSFVIASGVCTMLHTALVLGSLWIFNQEIFSTGLKLFITTIIGLNFVVECSGAMVLVPSLGLAIGLAKKKYNPYGDNTYPYRLTIVPILFVVMFAVLTVAFLTNASIYAFVPLVAVVALAIVMVQLRKE